MPLPDEILEQIDENYRNHSSLRDINDVAALAKSYVETKAMVGNSIRIPPKDAGDEARQEYLQKLVSNDPELMFKPDFANKEQSQEFFRTIGLPSEFSKYQNPEGMKMAEDVESEMRELLYQAKVPQAGYEMIMSAFSDRQNQMDTLNEEMATNESKALKAKWGLATDDRMEAAKQANEDFYPGRDFDLLTARDRESLYNISKAMTGKGAQVAGQEAGTPKDSLTPEEATMRADELLRRAQNASLNDMTREEIKSLVDQSMALRVKYTGSIDSLDPLRARGPRGPG